MPVVTFCVVLMNVMPVEPAEIAVADEVIAPTEQPSRSLVALFDSA